MSEQATGAAFPVGARVKYRAGLVNLASWGAGTDGVGVVQPGGRDWSGELVLVRWEGSPCVWERVENLEIAETEDPPQFPVGARVRAVAGCPTCAGEVLSPLDGVQQVCVRWDGGVVRFYEPEQLELADPPRAPERLLVLGIVVSADTCDGKPRIQGTRLRCDSMYSYWLREVQEGHDPESALGRVATDYHTGMSSVRDAVVWQAAVRYTKERRRAKKAKRGDRD